MAVNRHARFLLSALQPAPGLFRWIALRLGVVILSSVPALVTSLASVSDGIARRPYYTEVDGRLPFIHLIRLFRELPGSFLPAAAIGVVLAIVADQLLTGGALAMFDPARPAGEKVKVGAAVLRDGLTHLWAFLRTIGLSLVLMGVGIGLLSFGLKKLEVMAYRSAWSGQMAVLRLPLLFTLLVLVWLASVGAWTFWCRLLTVADGRVRVRRTGLLVFLIFVRHPLRSWGLFTGLTLLTTLGSGAALLAWRRAEPRTAGGVLGWALLWLFTLFVQSLGWVWLVRAGRLLYASEGLADVRSRPDDSFRLLGRLTFWRKNAFR
jgi:hypothetical protein